MILGIAGPAGAGKDTVADYLVTSFGFGKLSFAGPLKAMLAAAGWPEPEDRAKKEELIEGFDFTWRQAAQRLGTEFGRELDPDIWTKIVRRRVQLFVDRQRSVVISDVRFENEGKMIRDMGGSIIHLHGRKVDLGGAAAHVSESGVMFWPSKDHLIDNSGSRAELHEQVEMVVKGARNA